MKLWVLQFWVKNLDCICQLGLQKINIKCYAHMPSVRGYMDKTELKKTILGQYGNKTYGDETKIGIIGEEMSQDVGKALVAARLEAGLSVEQIAAYTRIPKDYIRYLESNQFERLPGIAYIPGFIRSYCKLVNLEPSPLVMAVKSLYKTHKTRADYRLPFRSLAPKMTSSVIAMLIVLVGLSGYVGWVLIGNDASQNTQIANLDNTAIIPQVTNFLAVPPLPAISKNEIEDKSETISEITAINENIASSTPIIAPPIQSPTNVGIDAQAGPRAPMREIVITAHSPSWVEIVSVNGDRLVANAGENLFLSTGNAGGLQLKMTGIDPFSIGKTGEILRDLPLKRETLESRRNLLSN